MLRVRLKDTAAQIGLETIYVPRESKDAVWGFMALNIDRLRPIGFDGHEVVCRPDCKTEIEAVIADVTSTN